MARTCVVGDQQIGLRNGAFESIQRDASFNERNGGALARGNDRINNIAFTFRTSDRDAGATFFTKRNSERGEIFRGPTLIKSVRAWI